MGAALPKDLRVSLPAGCVFERCPLDLQISSDLHLDTERRNSLENSFNKANLSSPRHFTFFAVNYWSKCISDIAIIDKLLTQQLLIGNRFQRSCVQCVTYWWRVQNSSISRLFLPARVKCNFIYCWSIKNHSLPSLNCSTPRESRTPSCETTLVIEQKLR